MKRKTFKTFVQRTTPSGMWDNGLYFVDGEVSFPVDDLNDHAIITKIKVKTSFDQRHRAEYEDAYRITLNDNDWIVTTNPLS